ncbi:hypothetical protein ATN81_09175 [Agrobacterium pusense]|nr:hypothetical protein ATN81_09175 [Agrobacterium pusense]
MEGLVCSVAVIIATVSPVTILAPVTPLAPFAPCLTFAPFAATLPAIAPVPATLVARSVRAAIAAGCQMKAAAAGIVHILNVGCRRCGWLTDGHGVRASAQQGAENYSSG